MLVGVASASAGKIIFRKTVPHVDDEALRLLFCAVGFASGLKNVAVLFVKCARLGQCGIELSAMRPELATRGGVGISQRLEQAHPFFEDI